MAQDVAHGAVENLKRDILRQLTCDVGVSLEDATPRHCCTPRRWRCAGGSSGIGTDNRKVARRAESRYLSMEFLMARSSRMR